MNKYVITNTTTKETQKVYSENSQEAKKAVCRTNGWKTAECSVRMITR